MLQPCIQPLPTKGTGRELIELDYPASCGYLSKMDKTKDFDANSSIIIDESSLNPLGRLSFGEIHDLPYFKFGIL